MGTCIFYSASLLASLRFYPKGFWFLPIKLTHPPHQSGPISNLECLCSVSSSAASPFTFVRTTQQQALQLLHDVYGGYWTPSCSRPARLAAVRDPIAVDAVHFGTPLSSGSVAPASNLAALFLPGSPSVGLGATKSKKILLSEAFSAAAQPAAKLYNQDTVWWEPSLAAPSQPSSSPPVVQSNSSLTWYLLFQCLHCCFSWVCG